MGYRTRTESLSARAPAGSTGRNCPADDEIVTAAVLDESALIGEPFAVVREKGGGRGARALSLRTRKRRVGIVVLAIGCVLATPSIAVAAVTPRGASSPTAAAGGVVRSELSGDWTAACQYFMPRFYKACRQAAATLGAEHFRLHGSVTLRQTVRNGPRALVAVTGRICPPSGQGTCQRNGDPRLGLPGPKRSFAAAFAAAVSPNSNSFSPIPCIETESHWYVDATPPS
jgi:uncharacterized protein YjeT (DUF2065 family)